jgi:hypothetical protein
MELVLILVVIMLLVLVISMHVSNRHSKEISKKDLLIVQLQAELLASKAKEYKSGKHHRRQRGGGRP